MSSDIWTTRHFWCSKWRTKPILSIIPHGEKSIRHWIFPSANHEKTRTASAKFSRVILLSGSKKIKADHWRCVSVSGGCQGSYLITITKNSRQIDLRTIKRVIVNKRLKEA